MNAKSKFSRDVLWNIVALGIAGVCGVGVNYLVGIVYGTGALGVFNQVFAAYLVASQIAALGIHASVLAYGAPATGDERRAIFQAGLGATLLQSLITAGLFLAAAPMIARFLDSPDVVLGMYYAAVGLVCFGMNKVLLAILNSLQRMRWYAVFQAGRVVFMAVGFGGCVLAGAPAAALPVILTVGELVVTIAAAIVTFGEWRGARSPRFGAFVLEHWRFGVRGVLSGLFSDLNTRMDIIILGAYYTDRVVGAYSLAALVAEGAYQILIALRSNYAPIVVKMLASGKLAELEALIVKVKRLTLLGALAVAAVSVVLYWALLPLLTSDPLAQRSWIYFGIILAGIAASAGYAPFAQLLLWAGKPGSHTILVTISVGVAALGNALLIARWEAVGAAVGTALMYLWSALVLKVMVRLVLKVSL